MEVWGVIDCYDHSEYITTVHMTKKGAVIQVYNILLEVLDGICDGWLNGETTGCYDEDEPDNEFKEEYPDAYEFVKKHHTNIEEAKLGDLWKHSGDLTCFVGEWTEWRTDVSIQKTRLVA